MYGYPRGASVIVTVSPLWLFSWSLCDWTKMALLCCCDQGKWCGEEKPITLPNGRTQRCTDSTQTQSVISPRWPYHSQPPRCPVVGHSRPAWGSSEGDNIVLKVINVGNVPVMGTGVPSNRRGTRCVLVVSTALVIGALLGGFGKCRSISNHFPIREKLLEHCTKIARGSFISNDNGRKVTVKSFTSVLFVGLLCCVFSTLRFLNFKHCAVLVTRGQILFLKLKLALLTGTGNIHNKT